jgi:hypothetical protein
MATMAVARASRAALRVRDDSTMYKTI